jgi:hypothetical protein
MSCPLAPCHGFPGRAVPAGDVPRISVPCRASWCRATDFRAGPCQLAPCHGFLGHAVPKIGVSAGPCRAAASLIYIPRFPFLTVPVLRWVRFVTVPVWSRLRFVTVPVRNRFRITGDSSPQYLNLCCESARFGSLAVRVGGSGSIPELTDIYIYIWPCPL